HERNDLSSFSVKESIPRISSCGKSASRMSPNVSFNESTTFSNFLTTPRSDEIGSRACPSGHKTMKVLLVFIHIQPGFRFGNAPKDFHLIINADASNLGEANPLNVAD